ARSLPIKKALDPDTIIALSMNGKPLPKGHGFPARLIVPGWYAMASVKWLREIILRNGGEPFQGHFSVKKYVYFTETNGRLAAEPITNLKVKSFITNLRNKQRIEKGKPLAIEGKAWSGLGRITKVELDFGEGWKSASLVNNRLGRYAWIPWKFTWVPKRKGNTIIRVRATDQKGNVQPELPLVNLNLYGYNAIHQVEVKVR
ncbi:MAG: molybdopterin-dependent oxidoreductase, partial [Thaumarchaeota archaeon]|nr:molybdopterin-dependent oxidoreductase [Nitrososphaerota archaeon]